MISVVIRVKNEARSLNRVLTILSEQYKNEIDEIVVVDNCSSDNSVSIAHKFKCKVVTIDKFTYGKALNIGIEHCKNKYVLLLSAHALPVGKNFFRNSINAFDGISNQNLGGLCFVNSIVNYERLSADVNSVHDTINFGLNAACGFINRNVWLQHKFNEDFVACEDKEWSKRITENGFFIKRINESFLYFAKRDSLAQLNRSKNEKLANLILTNNKQISIYKLFISFLKRLIVDNSINYFKNVKYAFQSFKNEIEILKYLNNK